MKIALDARFWRKETAGIGRYTRELVKELLRLGTNDEFHLIITPADDKECKVTGSNVTKHVVNVGHYSVSEQTKLLGLLNHIKADLVHFLNFNQPILYVGKRVTTIHDLTVKYFPVGRSQTNPIRRWAFNTVMSRAAHSNAVIVPSRATKVDVVKEFKIDPENIHVVYEAAGNEFKPRSSDELKNFKQVKNLVESYILFVSQWRPHKGLPELIGAFEALKKKGLPHKLVITGKPSPYFPDIQKAIESSPQRHDILTPGFVSNEDLPFYVAGADLLALPSYYEGFGLPVLEAMRSGTPVVTTNVSSLPEITGDASLQIPPRNVGALTEAITKILTDKKLAQKLGSEGLIRSKQFSWKKMARETYEVYRQVVDR